MTLYDESVFYAYSRKVRRGVWLVILPIIASLLLSIGLCFLLKADRSNSSLLHVLIVVINTLAGWTSLSVLLGYVVPSAKRRRLAQKILSFEKKEVRGKVLNMENGITVQEGIRVIEIQIDCADKTHTFFYDEGIGTPEFQTGDVLKMSIAYNFIMAYETENNHEEEM